MTREEALRLVDRALTLNYRSQRQALADAILAAAAERGRDRQRAMGLQYMSAETHDLAREIATSVSGPLCAVAGPNGVGWEDISTAPTDGEPVWVYVAMAHGLPPFEDRCSWHPDAGWCADELRPVTHWHPEMTQMLRDATRYRHIRPGSQLRSSIRHPDGGTMRDERADAKIDAEIAQEKGIWHPKTARENGK